MNTVTDLMLQSLLRGGLLAAGALLALCVMRRRLSAAVCHCFLACAVAALAFMPVLIATCDGWALLPRWTEVEYSAPTTVPLAATTATPEPTMQAEPATVSLPLVEQPARESLDYTPAEGGYAESSEPPVTYPAVAAPPSWIQRASWQGMLVTLWLLGMTFVIVGIVRECRRLHRLRHAALLVSEESLLEEARWCAARVGLCRTPELRLSQHEEGPLVIGALSSAVLLPCAFPSWPEGRRSAVLLHEMAHVKRRDAFVQLLGAMVCALHWCNPLAWLLLKRLRHEAECACDDVVLGAHMPARHYADHLLAVASGGRSASMLAPSMARRSGLRQRIQSVLNTTVRRGTVGRIAGLIVLTAATAFSLPVMLAQTAESKPAAAAVDSSEKIAVTLQAVDVAGSAVAGAGIQVFHTGKQASPTFEPDYQGTTDREGRWQVQLPPGQFLLQAIQGNLVGGFGESMTAWILTADKPEVVQQVKMMQGGIVEATVATNTGEPVANARVVMDTGHAAVTDGSGRAVFKGVPHGERMLLVMSPPMGDALVALNTTGRPVARVEARLNPGFEVRGKVTNRAGDPVAGAEVRYFSDVASRNLFRRRHVSVTGADGGYLMGWYSEARVLGFNLQVTHKEYAYEPGRTVTPPAEGTVSRCDFVLEKGKDLQCIVKDEDGKPMKGAVVRYMAAESSTDETGRATLANIRFDPAPFITVQAKGYQTTRMTVAAPKNPERAQVECVLKKGLTVEGRVIDRNGQPVSGVKLFPSAPVAGTSISLGGNIVSDAEGRFIITGLPESDNTLDVWRDGILRISRLPYDPRKPLVITVDKPGVIVGRVIDAETRQPVKKFRVQFGIADSLLLRDPIYQAEDGHFIREGLVLGSGYPVNILAEGYTQYLNERVKTRAMDDPAPPQEFVLERGIVVRGEIRDATTGRPVTGAKVLYTPRAQVGLSLQVNTRHVVENSGSTYDVNAVYSDRAGAVALHLPKETSVCSAFISAPGYAPVVLNGQPTRDGSLSIPPLTREAKLRGTVEGLKGVDWRSTAAGRGPVSIITAKLRVDRVAVHEDGSFEAGGLSAGSALVTLHSKGYSMFPLGSTVVELRAGETTTVDMASQPFAKLKVIVTKDGAPLPATTIMLLSSEATAKYGEGSVGGGTTGEDGTLTLEYLPRMKVMVIAAMTHSPPQKVDLSSPDHPAEIRFEALPARPLKK